MKFLIDHDVPDDVARVLGQAGHDVVHVRTALDPEASDQRVFEHAVDDQRVLVTCNRDDFLRLARGHVNSGLVIIIRRRTRIAECGHVIRLLNNAGESGITGNINFA